jgi:hypothetical protein
MMTRVETSGVTGQRNPKQRMTIFTENFQAAKFNVLATFPDLGAPEIL